MNNIEELKKAALAATPGPWEKCDSYGPNENGTCVSAVERPDLMIASTTGYYGRDGGIANAHFIALANPAAILDMIAKLEAAQKERDDLLNQEFQQRLANAEHQLYMKDLAIHNIKASRKAQFRKRLVAEAALSAANDKLSNPVAVPRRIESIVFRQPLEVEDMWRHRFIAAIKAAGFTVEE
ncbi:TPA: hypothetical protein ACPZRI_004103 [Yersinia enterocolitica]